MAFEVAMMKQNSMARANAQMHLYRNMQWTQHFERLLKVSMP